MKILRAALALSLPLAVSLAACGSPKDAATSSVPAGGGSSMTDGVASQKTSAMVACTKDTMDTVTKGQLTIGTDNPAYPPWFIDNTPSNGKGYESAVGFAIAKQLGYADGDVKWVTVAFNNAITPGKKNFDFDLNQVSISADRQKAVDFSSGYYDVTQTVVTYKGSPIASAKTVADLKGAKLGAQVGTTSYNAITDQIKPSQQASVFDTNDLAVQALKNHQIDGIVVDLPTAFYMTSAQLDDGVIVGQLPVVGTPEQFGAVLTKGSELTSCVSLAVDTLRKDGTLEKLQTTWLAQQGAPKLTE